MDYSAYVTYLAEMMVVSPTDPNFTTILPAIIDYAEQRIYRELDLLATYQRDASSTCTAGARAFSLPEAFIAIDAVNIITPAGYTTSDGTRNPAIAVARTYIDFVYASTSLSGVPQVFSRLDDGTLVFGPTPDAAYYVELVGTLRPTPISEGNPNTWLADNLPDVFLAASMVFSSGYQKNFGSQADDPKMSASWESQYQELRDSAMVEEFRRKIEGSAWTSKLAPVAAAPQRN